MKISLKNAVKQAPTVPGPILKASILSLLLVFSLLTFLAGCFQPSYPADRIIQSVKQLCQDEYDLDVQARVVGTTLGVAIQFEGLVDEEYKLAQDATKKIEQLTLSMRRIILSTDLPLDVYIVCARESKIPAAEYVMISATRDAKKATMGGFTRSEYLSRLQRQFRFNPEVLGQAKIKQLFAQLNGQGQHLVALSNYTRIPLSGQKIQQLFYPAIVLGQPQTIRYQIINIESREIAGQQALFWVKTQEFYTPQPQTNPLFPPGFQNEYLFRTDVASLEQPIVEMVPQFFRQENLIQQREMHQVLTQHDSLSVLDGQGLPIKEIKLKDFLGQQIARRLKEKLEQEPFKGKFQISTIVAAFEADSLRLEFNITGEEEVILQQALELVATTLYSYNLEDVTSIQISAQATGTKLQLTRDSLNQFRQ